MKFIKKSLALLLTVCMLVGLVPSDVLAKEAKASDDEFYKIVHLDAGRKYYSPDVIKQYIDTMATNGFNQLQLYFSDNQGFRFALDDMKVTTASEKTYDLTKALGNGYDQDYKSSHLNWYRPSLEPDGENYLTQAEMTDLISYARKRGIEIVPCLNMPGHMGAILEELPDFKYKAGGKVSDSSIDLENKDANEFALALLEKYVAYFEGQGCKYFNIGGDEYAYDIGNDISICNSATYTDYIVPFMNNAAEIIKDHGMTPRAFNDFFGWNKDAMLSKDFQICYWADIANGGGLKHISELIDMGYDKFINTNENWYFAVGSAYYTLDSTTAGVNTAEPYVFCSKNGHPETYENGLGAMFCIWSDRGRLDNATCNTDTDADGRTTHTNYSSVQEPAGGDGGQTVYELSKPFIEKMGTKLPKTPVVFHLDKNEKYILGQFEGKQTADEWAETLGLKANAYVDVSAEHIQEAVPNKIAKDPLKAFSNGDLVVVSDGTYYLTLKGEELETTTDPEKATIWKSDGKLLSANGLYLVGDPGYGGKDELVATAKPDGCGWKIVNSDNVMQTTNYGNKYITLSENGAGASSTSAKVAAYKVVPGKPDLTEVAIVGKAEGSVTFTYNDVKYTIVVGNAEVPVCKHDKLQHVEKVEPTQTEYGYEEHWKCEDCGDLFKDEAGTQKTSLNALRIDKLPHKHSLTYFEAKKATVTSEGNIEYWQCLGNAKARAIDENGGCGLCFSDAEGLNEISLASTVIPKLDEADGEHTINVAIGATHTCGKCVVTSVGKDLGLTNGSVKDNSGKEIATYTVKVEQKTETVGGSGSVGNVITKDTLDGLEINGTLKCALGNETTFMKADGSVCAKNNADVWTITKVSDGVYTIKGANGYVGDGTSWSPISIGDTAGRWKYDGTQFLNVATYYNGLGLRDGIWQTVYNTAGNNPTPLLPYSVETSGEGEKVTIYTYTYTFKGVAVGEADLTAGDKTFHVMVTDPSACKHENKTPANCVEPAHCNDCGADIGDVDPTNHKGPTETRYPNGTDSSNYTGDIYCTACDVLIKQGSPIDPNNETIHMYEDEVLEFFVACGNQPLELDTTGMDENVVVSVEAEHQVFVAGNPMKPVTDIAALEKETELIISDGTNFLKVTENEAGGFDISVTDKEDEATKFRVSKNPKKPEEFQLSYKGQMLRAEAMNWGSKLKMEAGTSFGSWSWKIKDNSIVAAWWPENGINLTDGAPRLMKDGEGASNVKVYTPNTNTPSGMNVKITAGAEGETKFKLGQNTYTVIVKPVILEGQKVTVDYFITNEWTGYEGSKAPDVHSIEITAADRHVNTPDGVELESLVPSNIMHRGFKTVYWKGTKHPADNMQYDMNHTGGDGALDVTKSKDTVEFKYLRFWGGHWSVSWNGKNWTNLDDGDQLVARYLLQTEVTEEVTTEVQDWGEVKYDNQYRVLLDFAVKYSSGDVRPDPDAYFIDGTSIFYHAIPGQDKVEDVNGVSHRRIDTIIGRETTEREVYMITLTPTSDDYTKRLEDSQMGAGGKYTYDGTEQIVWLENAETDFPTELTFHPDFQWGETPTTMEGNDRFAESTLPEGYDDWTSIGNTDGEPYVDQVKIYDHQGMLVTYYIRVKEEAKKDNLRVHYLEWQNNLADAYEFYNYGIAVKEGTIFDEGFAQDKSKETGLINNTVMNDLDFEQTVDSRLEKMPAIPAKYRTGDYTLHMVIRGEDGKDVYLYYAKTTLDRYIVADFGQPLNITWTDVLKGNLGSEYVFNSMSWELEGTDANGNGYKDELQYGDFVVSEDGKSCTYTPNKVFKDVEDTIHLKVNMTAPVIGEDGKPIPGQTAPVDKMYIVHILPATTVYYEPYSKYVTSTNWSVPEDENPNSQATYAVSNEHYPYGYDPMYDTSPVGASAGYEITANTAGAKVSMNFTGTGFELYANCTQETGRMMVGVKNASGGLVRMISVDTKIGAGTTEGTDFQIWQNAYNVPVVSLNGLTFGEYTVEVTYYTVNGEERPDAVKIDGFRVTHPINDANAKIAYMQNGEAQPSFVEVRDQVLAKVTVENPDIDWSKDSEYKEQLAKDIWSQVQANPDGSKVSGIIIENGNVAPEGGIAVDILDNGPKNELYLKNGQNLVVSVNTAYNYQLGIKAMDKPVNFYNGVMGGKNVLGSTDMYHRMSSVAPDASDESKGSITVINQSQDTDAVISFTKVKCIPKNQASSDEITSQEIFVPFTEASLTAALMSLDYDAEVPEEPENPDSNEWKAGKYEVNDVRSYEGQLWKCVQAHDSTVHTDVVPGKAPAFWIPYHGTSVEEAQEYVQPTGAHDAYQKGEYCIFKGTTYECKKNGTVYDPATYPQGWKKVNTKKGKK